MDILSDFTYVLSDLFDQSSEFTFGLSDFGGLLSDSVHSTYLPQTARAGFIAKKMLPHLDGNIVSSTVPSF